jgi:hypothetical protein
MENAIAANHERICRTVLSVIGVSVRGLGPIKWFPLIKMWKCGPQRPILFPAPNSEVPSIGTELVAGP